MVGDGLWLAPGKLPTSDSYDQSFDWHSGDSPYVKATYRYNASVQYRFDDHSRLSLSVVNVFNKMPPKDTTYTAYPYYDVSGSTASAAPSTCSTPTSLAAPRCKARRLAGRGRQGPPLAGLVICALVDAHLGGHCLAARPPRWAAIRGPPGFSTQCVESDGNLMWTSGFERCDAGISGRGYFYPRLPLFSTPRVESDGNLV